MNPAHNTGHTELARADILFLLSKTFAVPSEEIRTALFLTLDEAISLVDAASLPGGTAIIPKLAEFSAVCGNLDVSDWNAEYSRLFLGSIRCPIHESSYVRRDKGAILSDAAAFYSAFGVVIDPESHHRADHLCVQLEFVALLLVLLAQAKANDDPEAVAITQDAIQKFNTDHLLEWLPSFVTRLSACDPHPIYGLAADLLWSVWERMWDQPSSDAFDTVRGPENDPGTPYECDMV